MDESFDGAAHDGGLALAGRTGHVSDLDPSPGAVGGERCWRPDLGREWLLTDGLGGYAMGTEAGVASRRYHGLLVAAATPPLRRVVVLQEVVERVVIGDRSIELGSLAFAADGGASVIVHPLGTGNVTNVERTGRRSMKWTITHGPITLARHLSLEPGASAARLDYELTVEDVDPADRPVVLCLRPMVPLRGFHDTDLAWHAGNHAELDGERRLIARRDDLVCELVTSGRWTVLEQWWRDVAYVEDRGRGLGWTDDLWSPGEAAVEIGGAKRRTVHGRASLEVRLLEPAPPASGSVTTTAAGLESDHDDVLRVAADQFLAHTARDDGGAGGVSIIAGFPWFADWGRDAMIALPGLVLGDERRRHLAEPILLGFARYMHRGLVPNCFDDRSGRIQHNTVDASLWFVGAVVRSVPVLSEDARRTLLEACCSVIDAYAEGTEHGIRMDETDGMIVAGDGDAALTWMDAVHHGRAFTPRHGKPVEVQALWYDALVGLAGVLGDAGFARRCRTIARLVKQHFEDAFWWPERNCLHDVLLPDGRGGFEADDALRPNQLLAVSLPNGPLKAARRQPVVDAVTQALLTPVGLRTLSPDHPAYHGRFEGGIARLDAAYHQGTVWPWLLGPYVEAVLVAGKGSAKARKAAAAAIAPLLKSVGLAADASGTDVGPTEAACLGQVAEVYDGDAPHRPGGCPAQAWSVAELIRARDLIAAAGSATSGPASKKKRSTKKAATKKAATKKTATKTASASRSSATSTTGGGSSKKTTTAKKRSTKQGSTKQGSTKKTSKKASTSKKKR